MRPATDAEELGSQLLSVVARLNRLATQRAGLDVPYAQVRLLAQVEEQGPARISALAAADHCSQPTMTAQVQRLEAEGWVSREVDPTDARAVLVAITPAGTQALREARARRADVVAPHMAALSGREQDTLADAVDILQRLLAEAGAASRRRRQHLHAYLHRLKTPHPTKELTMWRQPKAVWAVAFASVIAFMGIGLVDPILKPIADQLNATPSQVSLLFTSYMAVMGVAMLITGAVASRIGAKRTLLIGLVIIIVGAGLAGSSSSIMEIVGWRALWGLGNALFVATALATIVSSARGSVAQAIILYEAALGLGIAVGPLVGGILGGISWRGPFYGVSTLMAVALVVTAFLLPKTPPAAKATSLLDPFRALRHRGLLGVAITALLYNFGFFTLLAFTPFPLDMGAHQIGLIFFGWGVALAFTSVVVAPRLQARFGTLPTLLVNLSLLSALLVVMAVGTNNKALLATCVVVAGLFLGINNTLVTETVMKAAPVERGVASAAYSFVRFSGGAVAPWLAGKLGEEINVHVPFYVGAFAVALGVGRPRPLPALPAPHRRPGDRRVAGPRRRSARPRPSPSATPECTGPKSLSSRRR